MNNYPVMLKGKEMAVVSPNVEKRLGFVHLHITDWTIFAGLQVPHNTHLAD
jgi:hypothetical protein